MPTVMINDPIAAIASGNQIGSNTINQDASITSANFRAISAMLISPMIKNPCLLLFCKQQPPFQLGSGTNHLTKSLIYHVAQIITRTFEFLNTYSDRAIECNSHLISKKCL